MYIYIFINDIIYIFINEIIYKYPSENQNEKYMLPVFE